MKHDKNAKFMILRSIGSPSRRGGLGFITKNRDTVPAGYQLLGCANSRVEASVLIFPN